MNSLWPLILVALVLVGSLNPNSPCPAQEVAAQHAGAARGWVQVSLPNSLPSDGIDDENTAEIVILNARLELPGAPEVKQSRLDIRPTALAIRDGRISAVGSDDEIRAWISKDQTRVVEAGGRSVAPGFIESHGHLTGLGSLLMELDLTEARSWDEVIAAVEEKARVTPKGQWIIGRGWHQSLWDRPPVPNVEGYPLHDELSRVSPDHPVFLIHRSGHASLANAEAMRQAKVSSGTRNPPGGEILRGSQSEPTGIFRETASSLIRRAYEASREEMSSGDLQAELDQQILLAQQKCFEVGVTTFVDAGVSPAIARHYLQMAERGKLQLPIWLMLRDSNAVLETEIPRLKTEFPKTSSRLILGGVKQMLDGALGSHGAWLLEPYEDLPESQGLVVTPLDVIQQTAELCYRYELQLCVHAIGDRANREVLNLFEPFARRARSDGLDLRWRIEHAQHLSDSDIPRFAELGVIASMQSIHATSDGPFVEERIGTTRARKGAYAWQELLRQGAVIVNGSDTPVEPIEPILGLASAVTRKCRDGRTFFPEQAMTRRQALRSYTCDAAYALRLENQLGRLEVGKIADLVVLSEDFMKCDQAALDAIQVDLTVIGGRVVFQRERE
ncbi:MAG: amidohydrolase [Planctomycetota bacterium]|nr:amidohydrolase [Planctomycetota bacterium]